MHKNMKIYGFMTFNVSKVLLAAVAAKIPFDYEVVDLAKGAQRSPDFAAINPYQKVPSAVIDGAPLWESGAICRYIGRVSEDKTLYPVETMAASHVDKWMEFSSCHITSFCGTIFFETFIAPRFLDKPTDEGLVKEASAKLDIANKILDDQLAKADYLTGANITLGDYMVFAPLHDAIKVGKYSIDQFSHLSRWFKAIEGSDVAKVVYGQYQKLG